MQSCQPIQIRWRCGNVSLNGVPSLQSNAYRPPHFLLISHALSAVATPPPCGRLALLLRLIRTGGSGSRSCQAGGVPLQADTSACTHV